MPGDNGRGPLGLGPKTGRGAGLCNENANSGYVNQFVGRCFSAKRRGNRSFFRRRSRENENIGIKEQLNLLREQLDSIHQKIKGPENR